MPKSEVSSMFHHFKVIKGRNNFVYKFLLQKLFSYPITKHNKVFKSDVYTTHSPVWLTMVMTEANFETSMVVTGFFVNWHLNLYFKAFNFINGNAKENKTMNNYWTRLSKISWFVSGEQINYLPKPKAEANNWSARHWQITIFCDNWVQ